MQSLFVIDSHTEGEPTRVVVEGFPSLGGGAVAAQKEVFAQRYDHLRRAIILEPRGNDVLVGALLCPSSIPGCVAGVIFFNNAGYLGMCGHGLIGVVATLQHLGRHAAGSLSLETPVGVVQARLLDEGGVEIQNVSSYRHAAGVSVQVEGLGQVCGDVAWGGNWFFLVKDFPIALTLENAAALTNAAMKIRHAVNEQGWPEVDHVEIFGPPGSSANHSRNFVLCPGGVYDRSPCGTGTSAKMACLAADGKLAAGEILRQEGILGTSFEASYRLDDSAPGHIVPSLRGRAFITAENRLLMDPQDPFKHGISTQI